LSDEAKENLGDQAMAGILAHLTRLHGDSYLTRGAEGFKKIIDARNLVTAELELALNGAAPDFRKIQKAYDEIDLAIPEVVHPKDAIPPVVPLATLLAGGEAGKPIASLPDFLSRVPEHAGKLGPEQKNLLDRANQDAPDALRNLLRTESEGSLDWSPTTLKGSRPFEALMAALERKGWSAPEAAKLVETVRGLKEAYHKKIASIPETSKAQTDAAIRALADPVHNVPEVGRLQRLVFRSRVMKAMLSANPGELMQWWRDYLSEPRKITFNRYIAARMNSVKGHLGEFTAAFELGRSGVLIFLKGPKADVNDPGTDMVCFDRNTGEAFYIDNKAVKAQVLNGVSALIRNFPKNMTDDIAEFRASMGAGADPKAAAVVRGSEAANGRIQSFLRSLPNDAQLRQRRLEYNSVVTLPTGERRPVWDVINDILAEHGISRLATNAGGKVERLNDAVRDAGILLEDLNAADKGDTE